MRREPEGEKEETKPEKGPFWNKKENEAKHVSKFRG
jgi:hypothetical protein